MTPGIMPPAIGPKSHQNGAKSNVQSGAVAPEIGTPGLNEKPDPEAILRAKTMCIHVSSSGNPGWVTIMDHRKYIAHKAIKMLVKIITSRRITKEFIIREI